MSKQIYISADYSALNGDRDVVEELHAWGKDSRHKVNYIDTATVVSGSVSRDPDCRPCDLKEEFNRQINVSSAVIFVVGDKTKDRIAGSSCKRIERGCYCTCTPYKQNANGMDFCNRSRDVSFMFGSDLDCINNLSYIEHEFLESVKRKKNIIIIYNSLYRQPAWLPSYMRSYEIFAHPFWKKDAWGSKVGDYQYIKKALGYV